MGTFFYNLFKHLIFISLTLRLFCSTIAVLLVHATNLAFAKIPLGLHTVYACAAVSGTAILLSFMFRAMVGSIVPFEVLFIGIINMILCDILYGMIKFIPVKDRRTGQTKRWAIGT